MMENMNGLSLELIVHPGETIKEIIEDREMTQEELSIRTGYSAKHVSDVINGKKDISSKFANTLEYALGIPTEFWINLQGIYDKKNLELEKINSIQKNEYNAIIENIDSLVSFGFELEDFGGSSVLVTAVPALLKDSDIKSVISEIAGSLIETGSVQVERLDDIYHIVACRSAVKAGNLSSSVDLSRLAERILQSDDIMYCPHGRPVAMKLTKREIEKQFGRIQ